MGIHTFRIGTLNLSSYFAIISLAVILCAVLMLMRKGDLQWTSSQLLALIIIVTAAGLFGARLYHSWLAPDLTTMNPVRSFLLSNGFSIDGAIALGIVTVGVFAKARHLPFLNIMDFFVAYAALGESIMRVGCFIKSCCYGRAMAIGVYCPLNKAVLFPVQLILAAGMFLIYVLLRKAHGRHGRAGDVFFLYLILRSILYFCADYFRARYYPLALSLSGFQMTYLLVLLIAGAFYVRPKHLNNA